MENVPVLLHVAFGLTTGLTVWLFCRATPLSGLGMLALLGWVLGLGAVALTGFFTETQTLPPRLALVLGPPLLAMLLLPATARGCRWLAQLRPEYLMLLHVVRVPVELVLFGLALHGAVPQLMTFEGRNWDILTGLTAPVMYYLVFRRQVLGSRALLAWNLAGLALLANIVVQAVLSVPSPVQRLAFEQPNVAVLYFPFVWLPGCVVPLALLAHLANIWQLLAPQRSLQIRSKPTDYASSRTS